MELLSNPATGIFGLSTLIATLLYLREYNRRRKVETQGDKFLGELQEKGLENLHQTLKKSQEIIGSAELEGVKTITQTRFESQKIEKDYQKKLTELIAQSQETLTSSQAQLIQFMADLQKRSQEFEEASRTSGEQRINQMFERLETRIADFLIQTEQKSVSSLELELKAARNLIESYKNQQLKLIDENIIAMMEQTLNLVLAKKLSLKDQLDLVYEALERAKVEKFIV